MLLAVLTLCSSCLSDSSSSTTYYDDAAITAFSLGTLKRVYTKKLSSGKDTTYTTTVACSTYKFTIDQEKGLIYNLDSLPVGTCANKALVTISTRNSGLVYLKSYTSDSVYYYSSSSDSLDFSKPRTLFCVSQDGTYHREYVADIRVHTETSDSVYWRKQADNADIAALSNIRGLAFNDKLYVYGTTADGAVKVYSSDNGKAWAAVQTPFETSLTMVTDSAVIYALSAGKTVYTSADGQTWLPVYGDGSMKCLVAASRSEVYALSNDGRLMVSKNNGATWAEDELDSDKQYLPSRDINGYCVTSAANSDLQKVTLIGNRADDNDSTCVVWTKTVDNVSTAETQRWMYQPFEKSTWHHAPRLNNVAVIPYEDGAILMGGTGIGACSATAFSTIYYSRDSGMNWWADTRYTLPDGFTPDENAYALFTDTKHNMWLVSRGQVWMGYLSQLKW